MTKAELMALLSEFPDDANVEVLVHDYDDDGEYKGAVSSDLDQVTFDPMRLIPTISLESGCAPGLVDEDPT